ncbi:hypothetical protein E2562_016043 [Oryza meyeriana var. granulata]|uniref:Uncharacterized protein n=1 Tax=Oryza meyeriana var. granulata TaxID=110450 RepID=A0A6G1BLE5_9ORYZ|nr:hypothetical protein E2562_016043 [Oryza meyeriana var. granulata]
MAKLISTVCVAVESNLRDGNVPMPEELAEATNFGGRVAAVVVNTIVLKDKLTRGVAAFAGRPGRSLSCRCYTRMSRPPRQSSWRHERSP